MLNRLMSPVVLKCLKQPGVTGKTVKYRVNRDDAGSNRVSTGTASGDTDAFREHPGLHRDKPCAMKTPGIPDFSTLWFVPTAKPQISLRLGTV